jgi:hypothetical protein
MYRMGIQPELNTVRPRGLSKRQTLVGEVCANFADKGHHVVSAADAYDRILGFSRQEPLLFFQVAPQTYSPG